MTTSPENFKQDIVKTIVRFAEESEQFYGELHSKWRNYYKLFRFESNDPYGEEQATKANVVVPEIFSNVMLIHTRHMSVLSGMERSIVSVIGEDKEDNAIREVVARVTNAQLRKSNYLQKFKQKMDSADMNGLITGTTIIKPFWRYEEKEQKKRFQASGREDVVDVETNQTVSKYRYDVPGEEPFYSDKAVESFKIKNYIDKPDFVVCNNDDIFPDPEAVDIQDARYIIHRMFVSKKDLEFNETVGVYGKKAGGVSINSLPEPCGYKKSDSISLSHGPVDQKAEGDTEEPTKNKRYELLEYWEDDVVRVVADRKYLIRDDDNPYECHKKPFIKKSYIGLPNRFWGIGVVEPQESLSNEMQKKRNQLLDAAALRIRSPLIANSTIFPKNFFTGEFKIAPNRIMPTFGSPVNEIIPMPCPAVGEVLSFQDTKDIQNEMRNAVGTPEYLRGSAPSKSRETKGSVELKTAGASARLDYHIDAFFVELLLDISEWYYYLDQQFIVDEQLQRILGEKWKMYPRDAMYNEDNYDFTFGIDPVKENEAIRNQQLLNAFGMLQQNPFIDKTKLIEIVLNALGIPEAEELVKNPVLPLIQFIMQVVQQTGIQPPPEIVQIIQEMAGEIQQFSGSPEGGGQPGGSQMPGNMPRTTSEADVAGNMMRGARSM